MFRSWNNPRADVYRKMHDIPATMGTAVNVQAMVFGNLGDDCATGVAFTRNPSTGDAGSTASSCPTRRARTSSPASARPSRSRELAKTAAGGVRASSSRVAKLLEEHFRDMQDLEFTIQQGKLYMLQTRNGKRTGKAMVQGRRRHGRRGQAARRSEAVLRVDPAKLDEVLHPTIDPKARPHAAREGPAGVARRRDRPRRVHRERRRGVARSAARHVILVRIETSPEDIHGMKAAGGILTARGGMTSHAAVVARGMGKCCVTGVHVAARRRGEEDGVVRRRRQGAQAQGGRHDHARRLDRRGLPRHGAARARAARRRARQADGVGRSVPRGCKVRTNADTPTDARTARSFGAEGIGLCRTEHMFFQPERILAVREMILADDEAGRRAALAKILPMQRGDFVEIFRVMDGLPVTIRLLDPPLHEFLPHTQARDRGGRARDRQARERDRGEGRASCTRSTRCSAIAAAASRSRIPEIYEMQVAAIGEAAAQVAREGVAVHPEIMIPLVDGARGAAPAARARRRAPMDKALGGATIPYTIGTMIELPRACVVADRIAEHADFFSFGTNDLTQTTFGLSRDDAGRFLPATSSAACCRTTRSRSSTARASAR